MAMSLSIRFEDLNPNSMLHTPTIKGCKGPDHPTVHVYILMQLITAQVNQDWPNLNN